MFHIECEKVHFICVTIEDDKVGIDRRNQKSYIVT